MIGRKSAIGLSLLCAIFLSVFVAPGALAASKGTTAFTCKETGAGGTFTKAHCKPSDAGSGKYSHVAIPQDTATEITANNETTGGETTSSQLMFAFGDTMTGVATEVTGAGVMENKIDGATGEHYIRGEGTLTYTGISEIEGGCSVYTDNGGGEKGEKGVVHTNVLEFTTKGQGDFVKIAPKEGTTFATAILDGCSLEGLNATYKWVGSMKCPIEGATIVCNKDEILAAKTMRVNTAGGPLAGLFGTYTLKGRANSGESYTPISPTTVETG
jgi:hypothetical protein